MEAGGKGLVWSDGENGAGVLEDEGRDRRKERWEWERTVVVKRDSDLRSSLAASLIGSMTSRGAL